MADKDNNNSSEAIRPLYEEIRHVIYQNFEAMKRQNAIVQTSMNKNSRYWAIINFKERFCNFFMEVNHENKLNKISEENRKFLENKYENLNNLTKKDVSEITKICRELLEALGISNIEYNKEKAPF